MENNLLDLIYQIDDIIRKQGEYQTSSDTYHKFIKILQFNNISLEDYKTANSLSTRNQEHAYNMLVNLAKEKNFFRELELVDCIKKEVRNILSEISFDTSYISYITPRVKEEVQNAIKVYPKIIDWMKKYITGSGDVHRKYKTFLRDKNKLESDVNSGNIRALDRAKYLGYTPETTTSPAFGTKIFLKTPKVKVMYADIFQYLLDQKETKESIIKKEIRKIIFEYIRKHGSKWQVISKKGKTLGTHSTRKSALKQLRAIEYFKHK